MLDFGISKFADAQDFAGNLTADGAVMGTPYYMSPEQARGDSVDARTDIYALGILLYEALAGKVPFIADTFSALVVRIMVGDCEHLTEVAPHIDPALADVVHKAMATDPAERYGSVRELQEALRPFADRELPERFGSESDLALGGTMLSDPTELLPETRISAPSAPPDVVPVLASSTVDREPTKSRAPLYIGLGAIVVVGALVVAFGSQGEAPEVQRDPVSENPVAEVMDAGPEPSVAIDADVDSARAAEPDAESPVVMRPTMRSESVVMRATMMVTMRDDPETMQGTLTMMGTTIETDIDL